MASEFVYVQIKLFSGTSSIPELEDKLYKGPLCMPLTPETFLAKTTSRASLQLRHISHVKMYNHWFLS